MFNPAHFREERLPVLHEAIREIGFATLVTERAEGLTADHLPVLLQSENNVLIGHVARANPMWQETRTDREALAIFLGPYAYVTPSWYPTKTETGKVVPTWNYIAVHLRGRIEFFDDRAELRAVVAALTARHEAGRETPWSIDDAPDAYIESMLQAIVGFRFVITHIEGKWKMSQNRSSADRAGVMAGMAAEGRPDIVRHLPK